MRPYSLGVRWAGLFYWCVATEVAAAAFRQSDCLSAIGLDVSENRPYQLETRWRIVEQTDCFIVEDASGFALAHLFFAPAETSDATLGQMSRSEARAAAEKMVAAQDRKIAIRQAAKKLEAGQRELGAITRTLH